MKITSRQQLLLKTLLEQVQPLSSGTICRILECSSRTLRYDMEAINRGLGCKFILSGKSGYAINRNLDVSAMLKKLDYADNAPSDMDRLVKILLEKEQVDISDFSLHAYVSESAAEAYVRKKLNPELERFGLNVAIHQHSFVLEGKERAKRSYLVERIIDGAPPEHFLSAADRLGMPFKEHLTQELKKLIGEYNIELDDIFFVNLLTSLLVTFFRCADGHAIMMEEASAFHGALAERITDELCGRISEEFHIIIDENDKNYIAQCIDVYAKGSADEDTQKRILADTEFCEKIENALLATFYHFGVKVDYTSILNGLTLHCWYLFARVNANARLHNDLTEKLRYGNPFVYELSVYMVFLLEQIFDTHIPYNEIGLLAVHLGSILDFRNMGGEPARAICVCSRYRNLRDKLSEQLYNLMGDKIQIVRFVSTVSHIDDDDSYDFIISVERENTGLLDKMTVNVCPFITPLDCLNIERMVLYVMQSRRNREYRELMERYFDESLFFYRDDKKYDAMEVLELLNEKMLSKDYVDESFLPSVLARERLASTAYFRRFAVPHAMDVNAKETKIAFFYSKQPIEWFGTSVNLVLLLATQGYNESFSKLYEFMFSIMMNIDLYSQMEKCSTYEQLCEFFRNYF